MEEEEEEACTIAHRSLVALVMIWMEEEGR